MYVRNGNPTERAHMLHRVDATMERFLLHPRVVDVVEALVGPDVLALQTMQFYNQPRNPEEHGGQGWHQDSKYIATYPDTLASLCRTAAGIRTRDFYVTGDPTLLPPNVLL